MSKPSTLCAAATVFVVQARTLNEPKDYDYGMRDFEVLDLDGNQLSFGMESRK